MIGMEVILSLIGLAILGAVMNLIAVQQYQLKAGESARQGHLSIASTFFLFSAYLAIFMIFLAILIKVLVPFEISPTVMNGLILNLPYLMVLFPSILILLGFAKVAMGTRLKEKFKQDLEEFQKGAVLKLIESLDTEGINKEDLTICLMDNVKPGIKQFEKVRNFLSDDTRKILNVWITWIGAKNMLDVIGTIVPTYERMGTIVDALIRQKKVIETDNGYLISHQNLKQLVKENRVRIVETQYWGLGKKKYTWDQSKTDNTYITT